MFGESPREDVIFKGECEEAFMSRQELHSLIDTVDEKEIDLLYALILKFIPSGNPLPDEIEAIRQGEEDYKKILMGHAFQQTPFC